MQIVSSNAPDRAVGASLRMGTQRRRLAGAALTDNSAEHCQRPYRTTITTGKVHKDYMRRLHAWQSHLSVNLRSPFLDRKMLAAQQQRLTLPSPASTLRECGARPRHVTWQGP